jgi:hypothetical protein
MVSQARMKFMASIPIVESIAGSPHEQGDKEWGKEYVV